LWFPLFAVWLNLRKWVEKYNYVAIFCFTAIAITIVLGHRFYNQPRLAVGTIAPQTITAPYSARVEDIETTKAERKAARTVAAPILKINELENRQIQTQIQKILDIGNESRLIAGGLPFVATSNLSIIGEGCILRSCRIQHSVLGVRSRIEAGCTIDDSLIMGADYYQPFAEEQSQCESTQIPLGIGANSTIRRAIIDKNARIGCDVQIVNKDRVQEAEKESQGFFIRSGIVVVLKNAVIKDGTVI
jgi:membrane-associated HD superfamily phosphohydrolase